MIKPINVSFGYSNRMTKLYKDGKITLQYDLKGDKLNPDTIIKDNKPLPDQGTFEHIRPHSQGGTQKLGNCAIVTYENNQKRGNMPFWEFYDIVGIVRYFSQFLDLKVKGFNGNEYIREAFSTMRKENSFDYYT